ncbi:hypothetical protein PF003_g13249 [Phytophthora fragariae]|nr:hypothetical protein PF003_g13249 [Phytophthora fragariae]
MDGLHPAQQVVPLLVVVHCGGPIQDGKQPLTPVEQVLPPLQLLDFCRVIAATRPDPTKCRKCYRCIWCLSATVCNGDHGGPV